MAHDTDRRSVLGFLIFGLGAIFSLILGAPAVCYFLDPRHRKGPKSDFKVVEGIKLDEIALNSPKQGVIRDRRVDGWTLYPNDVIGRVWVVQVGQRPANIATMTTEQKAAFLTVYTTICPHLGCAVNLDNTGTSFACPCHNATFSLGGTRLLESNPAKRGMDTLEWEVDADDPEFNRIRVKYVKYQALETTKIPVGGA